MSFAPELKALVVARAGSADGNAFQAAMKSDHHLAMEYVARLLRYTVNHHGPVTRLRDHLTLIVDNADRIERAILGNDGSKSSALEVADRLKSAAATGLAKGLGSKNAERKGEVPQFKEPEIDRTRQRGISL